MNRILLVHVDLEGKPVLCGRLWTRSAPREGASFEYDAGWRSRPGVFALDPELPRKDDEWPVTRWEATTLSLARSAGIQVPKFRLEQVARSPSFSSSDSTDEGTPASRSCPR